MFVFMAILVVFWCVIGIKWMSEDNFYWGWNEPIYKDIHKYGEEIVSK